MLSKGLIHKRLIQLLFSFVFLIGYNGLHMACGGFEALHCPPKPKLDAERKPCWQPFTRHKLYALLAVCYFINNLVYFIC